jgi:PIN like domain
MRFETAAHGVYSIGMRKSYPGYTRPTEKGLEKLWTECVFTFDASALLDLYRLTPDTREAVLNILDRLKDRLWLAHQAGLEYHDNRIQVIATGLASYSRIPELARELAKTYRKNFDIYRQYRWIEADRWAAVLEEAVKKIEDMISKEKPVLKGFPQTDPVEEKLNEIFDGKVGPPYNDMHDIYLRAEQRLQLSIPPGFKDASLKKDFHRYGDVVLWLQILDYAKAQKKNIIFVTSDAKTDWWLVRDGKTVGPRPELLQEMHATAGVTFHMYSPDRFVEYAEKHLKSKVKPAVLKKTTQELRAVETEKSAQSARLIDEYLKKLTQVDARLMEKYLNLTPQVDVSLMEKYLNLMQVDARLIDEYLKKSTPQVDVSLMEKYLNSTPQVDVSLVDKYLTTLTPAKKPSNLDAKNQPNASTNRGQPASDDEEDTPKSDTAESSEKEKPE